MITIIIEEQSIVEETIGMNKSTGSRLVYPRSQRLLKTIRTIKKNMGK